MKNSKASVASMSIGNTYTDSRGYPIKVVNIIGTGDTWKIVYQYEDGQQKVVISTLDKEVNLYN